MGNPIKTEPRMNAEAFMAWYDLQPDGKRYELLDGAAYEMQSERAVHARTKARVYDLLARQIAKRNLNCEAFPDGMAVRVEDDVVFEPDALVRCGPRLPGDAVVILDPTIVVEVASPSTQNIDVIQKLALYFRNKNILHYLIVLPARKIVIHHNRKTDSEIMTTICSTGALILDPPGLSLDIEEVFADANA